MSFERSQSDQELIRREEQAIQEVESSLKIGTIGGSNSHIHSITTSFPLKGNKKIVDELMKLGWVTGRRFKRRTDGGWTRNQYDGYEMMQYMHKYFSQL